MIESSDIVVARERIAEPDLIRHVLANRVREVLAAHEAEASSTLRVVRLVVPVEPWDPFLWLQAQQMLPGVYWSGRDDDLQTAAIGAADLCTGSGAADYDTLRVQLDRVFSHSDAQTRYFGGFRFDRLAAVEKDWASFGTYTFVLPRFELNLQGKEAILACNLVLPRDQERMMEILAEIDRLVFPAHPLAGTLPLPIARTDSPDREGWQRNIEWALSAFTETPLDKIVLARKATFEFAEALDAVLLLKHLREATPNCFHFCFQPDERTAFVGASPERLFRREGRTVWSEAVAGTRPRGGSEQSDAQLREELLQSEKDQREHEYVRMCIREALEPLSHVLHVDPVASEMKLARGWHLVSRVRGMLVDGVAGSDVMGALHPTPAVGGYPTEGALRAIRELEPFDRGWYAGPVGWIGTKGAEFSVAIRSGLVQQNRLSLYSGAGIVLGSTPESEWNEIEQKISDFIKVLGLF